MNTQLPPQNIDAERGVLCAILFNQELLTPIETIFNGSPTPFYQDNHNAIFTAMKKLVGKGTALDPIVLDNELGWGMEYITDLYGAVPTSALAEPHARIVLDCHNRRQVMDSSAKAYRVAGNTTIPIEDTITTQEAKLASLHKAEEFEVYCDDVEDPGPITPEMLEIPGFISRHMAYTMSQAPYPNLYMSFCGALSLLATLMSRKTRDRMNTRTNLYILGLAEPGSGKDMPRKVNRKIMHNLGEQTGDTNCGSVIVDKFGSAEGIEDGLSAYPIRLWQCDEITTLIDDMKKGGDGQSSKMAGILMQMFTTSDGMYTGRLLARAEGQKVIHAPCLTVFGTAPPGHYYGSLTEKMLTDGFFARQLIIEDMSHREANFSAGSNSAIPMDIMEEAQTWWLLGSGDAFSQTDSQKDPAVLNIPWDSYAEDMYKVVVGIYDKHHRECKDNGDTLGCAVWGRAGELTRKMSMIYAGSRDGIKAIVDQEAIDLMSAFIMQQTRRMIYKAREKSFSTDHEKSYKKVIELLKASPEFTMKKSKLADKMRYLSKKELDEVVDSMVESRQIKKAVGKGGRGRPPIMLTLVKQED